MDGVCGPPNRAGVSPPALLPVALYGVRVAGLGLVGIHAGVPQSAALAQQIPANVELDLDRAQAICVGLERIARVALLAVAQLVLLADQPLDPRRDALVAHRPNPTPP